MGKVIIKTERLVYLLLIVIGIAFIVGGVIFNPDFVARHLSQDGILEKRTRVAVYILNVVLLICGLGALFYSLLKIRKNRFAGKIEEKVKTYFILPWNNYWFRPIPLRRLAIFRIAIFGFLVIHALFIWIPDYVEQLKYVSKEFFDPIYAIKMLHLDPPSGLLFLDSIHILLILFAIAATIGFMTRFSIFISLALYLYIVMMWWSFEGIHRSESPPFVFAMAALLLSPCGKVLSVDQLLARMRVSKEGNEFEGNRTELLESGYALWPLRLTQIFVAFTYFNAGYWKLKLAGLSWANGSTLQYHLIDHNLRGHSITDLGLFISQFPLVCTALSVFSLGWELSFPIILVFPQLAWFFLPVGILFHIGTGIMMATWFYPLWVCYLAFIDVDAVGAWFEDKFHISNSSGWFKSLFDGVRPIGIRSMNPFR